MANPILCYQTISPLPYQEFMEGRYEYLDSVRKLGSYEIFSASQDGMLLLFIVEHDIHTARKCVYENLEKQKQDIDLWRRLPPSNDEESGVMATLSPLPPTLTASNARPFPPDVENEAKYVE